VDAELAALADDGIRGPWLAERRADARALLDILDRRATALRRVAQAVQAIVLAHDAGMRLPSR
jgi:hypothetical protein